jgi:hypothetical protein
VAKSEKKQPPNDAVTSDRAAKANAVPVVWGATTPVVYAKPSINGREPIAGLLTVAKSEKKQPPNDVAESDRAIKANVVLVRW